MVPNREREPQKGSRVSDQTPFLGPVFGNSEKPANRPNEFILFAQGNQGKREAEV